jgi:acetyl esterase/lipase
MKIYRQLFILVFTLVIASCQKGINDSGSSVTSLTILDVSYGSSMQQKMDVYLPANRNSTSTKVMVMIHGGGWNTGDKSELTQYADSIRKRLPDYAVININYRLALGSDLFPTQENDVKAAIQFLLDHSAEYKISQKYVLLGVSAGAHLALLQSYKYASQVNPKAVISFFGPTDLIDMYNHPLNPLIAQSLASVVGKTPAQDSLLYANSSPVNFVKSSSSPTMLLQGGVDPIVSVTQATMLKAKLDAASVVNQYVFYPSEGHGWFGANLYDSFNKIEVFIKANVN